MAKMKMIHLKSIIISQEIVQILSFIEKVSARNSLDDYQLNPPHSSWSYCWMKGKDLRITAINL